MIALILAAGRGSRLNKNTKDKPKALVEVGCKPILQYQLEALQANGIYTVVLVVGYKGSMIVDYCQEYQKKNRLMSFTFIENENWAKTNSAYSFFLARQLLRGEPYLHLNCDIIFDKKILRSLLAHGSPNNIVIDTAIQLADNMEQVEMTGNVITKMDNVRFEEAIGKAVGVAKISPNVTEHVIDVVSDRIVEGQMNDNFFGILHETVEQFNIFGYKVKEGVCEINTEEDLHDAS